jgi:hypothetical protein
MPYRLVSSPPPARRGGVVARVSDSLRHRAGALLGLAVALALVAATAAVFLPRPAASTAATAAAERRAAAQATAAMRARGIAQHADRADRSPAGTSSAAAKSRAATTAARAGTKSASGSGSDPAPGSSSSYPTPSLLPAAARAPGGIAWGTSVMPYAGESYSHAWSRDEQSLAPEIVRFFNPGTGGPHWPSQTGSMPLVISFKLPPAQVVDGSHDAQLAAFFAATPRLTYWSYWHEPEDDIARGAFTAAAYRAAWTHIAVIARDSGKPLRATLILMGFSTKPGSGRTWTDYYAGPNVIDVLGWDCYSHGRTDTPATIYGSALNASLQAGKPWAIAETGVPSVQVPNPAERQAKLTAMATYLSNAQERPEFVTYFDSDPDAPNIAFGWNISHDAGAAAAWRAGQTG